MVGLVLILVASLAFPSRAWGTAPVLGAEDGLHGQPLCRGVDGEVVDWWFTYKREGDGQYVFTSSSAISQGKKVEFGLSSTRLILDPKTSPLLRTVYGGAPLPDDDFVRDSWLAVGDQRGGDGKTPTGEALGGLDDPKTDSRLLFAWNDQQPPLLLGPSASEPQREIISPPPPGKGDEASDGSPDDDGDGDEDYAPPEGAQDRALQRRLQMYKKRLGRSGSPEAGGSKGATKDANLFGKGSLREFGHSKGIMGINFQAEGQERGNDASPEEGYINMYLINHSFPQTPNGAPDSIGNGFPILRRHLVQDPGAFFGSNITTPSSKAQHALCISMRQKVKVKDGEIVYDRAVVDRKQDHLFNLLEGLGVVGVNLTLANYVPWLEKFRIYHQLFDIRSAWSAAPLKHWEEKIENLNLARKPVRRGRSAPPARQPPPPHAFPIWPSAFQVGVDDRGRPEYTQGAGFYSLRDGSQAYRDQCQVWSTDGDKDEGCFLSALFTTTSFQHQVKFSAVFKNALVEADTDTLIAPFLMPSFDWDYATAREAGEGVKGKKYAALMLITQSWFDHATLGPRALELVNTPRFRVKVRCHNSLGVELPRQEAADQPYFQRSLGRDHSKWFVSYLYLLDDRIASYRPTAGVMDLNRNAKATSLMEGDHGRGGMILLSSDPAFVEFFLSLNPVMEDNQSFSRIPPSFFLPRIVQDEESLTVASVERVAADRLGMSLRIERRPLSESHKGAIVASPTAKIISFQTPYCIVLPDGAHHERNTGSPAATLTTRTVETLVVDSGADAEVPNTSRDRGKEEKVVETHATILKTTRKTAESGPMDYPLPQLSAFPQSPSKGGMGGGERSKEEPCLPWLTGTPSKAQQGPTQTPPHLQSGRAVMARQVDNNNPLRKSLESVIQLFKKELDVKAKDRKTSKKKKGKNPKRGKAKKRSGRPRANSHE